MKNPTTKNQEESLILVTGGFAATTAIIESPIMGFAEKLTIAANLQWTFFMPLKMYATSK